MENYHRRELKSGGMCWYHQYLSLLSNKKRPTNYETTSLLYAHVALREIKSGVACLYHQVPLRSLKKGTLAHEL